MPRNIRLGEPSRVPHQVPRPGSAPSPHTTPTARQGARPTAAPTRAIPSPSAPEATDPAEDTAWLQALATPGARVAIVGPAGSGRRERARALAANAHRPGDQAAPAVVLEANRGFTDVALQLLAWQQSQAAAPGLSEGEPLRELLRRSGLRAPLLVLEDLPCDEGGQALERLLAQDLLPGCRRLVTQRTLSERGGGCLELAGLPEGEALALLASARALGDGEEEACRELVRRIAGNPLAVGWLGRAAERRGELRWSDMLARHRALENEALHSLAPRSDLAETPGCAALLLAIWQDLDPQAQRLGLLLGAMAAAPIPTELLDLCATIEPAVAPQEGLSILQQAGLVALRPAGAGQPDRLEIHGLVHAFLRQQRRLDPERDASARSILLQALGHVAHGRIAAGLSVAERLPLVPLLPHLREVVRRERHQRPDVDLLWPALGLGRLLEGLEGDEDSRLLQACLEICESVLGPDHPDTAVAQLNLAALHDNTASGDARAETLLLSARAVRSRCFGDEDPATMAAQGRLGMVLAGRGELERAIPLLEEALASREQRQGPLHPDLLGPLSRLMALQEAHGAHARAERLGRRILAIQEQLLGLDHPERAQILQRLGHLQEVQGHPQRAMGFYSSALDALKAQLGAKDPALAPLLGRLGALALARGEEEVAEHHVRQALALLPSDDPQAAIWLQDLARLHQGRGELQEAERLSREALALRERTAGPWNPLTATALNALAWVLSQRQANGEARTLCERALAIRRRSLGAHHLETASSLNTLAALHEDDGDPEQALTLYQEALDITETQLGADHPGSRTVRDNLRSCRARVEQLRQAS